MAAIEIDEAEYTRLANQDKTVQRLWGNTATRRKIQEALKLENPNVRFPDLDAEEAAQKPVKELEAQVADLKKQMEDEKAENAKLKKLGEIESAITSGVKKLKDAGYTDEGVAEVRKLMEEKGILDVDIAAAYFEKQNPPQTLAMPRSGAWDFTGGIDDSEKELKALLDSKGRDDRLVDTMARNALTEARGAQRR